jgi:NADPH2:quinone reductase
MNMRAVVFTETGACDVLKLVDREAAEPGAGEVRVRVAPIGRQPD